ncbi:N-acetylmuramoyl-L-alanine amidase [Lysinibacillus sp. FSL M8-0216]|uniref:N-acetylmuramoyl-L-alanine amidase n=1 Tax=Lysinibacillus fusiformis TaxID=28031 RepID=A0A1H9LWZ5_9BACI|nr:MULTISPECIES: N-acetylmuramoyl-L-alanine amidase [Lysinibacillus]MCG7433810.1 N-acetylmuramoyl-L-alanine amidase [Lysinibacillus fusiformis]MED4668256.1 N-acetylmuramoyl-L-alanine amidase [Lysinibacillus fusiformis]SCX65089.1 N-acetylmuramoyl-L-alanine amidase [Lysinibacillus fusiformis]SCY57713.1 N-acetylmuramoyl-L-alanine amidase [Lysinibacillus fusiformis]SDB49728.1 N-acetylmuramoyl-L-alanine amidase [Lysinibacillus fusiformis]
MNIKKISLILCVLFISASMFTIHSASVSAATNSNITFEDVTKNHPAYEEINYLVSLGVIQGYFVNGKRVFGPNNNVTRGQAAKMVVVASGNKPLIVNKSSFSDVTVGTEMSGYIERAVQLGFFDKNIKGEFLPNKALTRGEMSYVLTKAFNLDTSEYEGIDSPFTDVGITHEYVKYINTIYYNGITNGTGKTYLPNSTVTRSQFSLFVARAKSEKYRLELPVKGVTVPDTSQVIGLVKVTTDGLNIRKSTDSASTTNIVGKVNTGGKLSVYAVEGNWLKVSYKGAYAYIFKQYAEFLDADGNALGAVEKEVTTKNAVNLYVKPTSSAKVISTIKANVKLPVYKTVGGYYLTQVNGLPGYVVANSTTDTVEEEKPNPNPDPGTPPVTSGDVLGRVTVANLNVRSQSNSTSAVLFKLNKGEYVQVNSISGYWAEITYNGQTGYVHKSYLKLLNQSAKPLQNRVIILDPGHGGKDPGTVKGSVSEKSITLKVSTQVKQLLENAGAKVYMTRTGDTYPSLQDRVDFTQANYGEIFVSVHVNSAANSSAQGTETYYAISTGDMYQEDIDLATFVNNQIVNNLNMKNRGVKQEQYYVIRNMVIPSILVELGFLTNTEDHNKMTNDQYVNLFAESIYNGILQYYKKQ